jgi:hypothetical protein
MAQPFAKPILTQLRATVHATCPDVVETIKWGMPAFDYRGPFCGMAAFKEHASFGFWKGKLIKGLGGKDLEAMGNFGCLKTVKDIPAKKEFVGYLKQAMALNESGTKAPRVLKHKSVTTLKPPADLKAALGKNPKAEKFFDTLPPGQRGEYIAWITEAKRQETRKARVKTAVEWMGEGKRRNWKYETKKG